MPIAQYEEGQSLTSIWAVKSLGIDPTTGKEIYLNRDGTVSDKWDATQEVVVGNTEPKFNGAFGVNLTYRDFGRSSGECSDRARKCGFTSIDRSLAKTW